MNINNSITIQVSQNPCNNDYSIISENLFEYNCETVGINDYQKFGIYLRDDQLNLVGGINGWTRWQWAHIENVWIDSKFRNMGYGAKLLQEAEELARIRKCKFIDLDTFDFQAPNFYEKQGYILLFSLNGIGEGITKNFYKKEL